MDINILLIEDEWGLAELIADHLNSMARMIRHLDQGHSALEVFLKDHWDLVLLDLRLPDANGIDICLKLREQDLNIPIILISGRTSNAEILEGFNAGADDYITKPFNIAELTARVRALLRRAPRLCDRKSRDDLIFGDLAINPGKHTVKVAGQNHKLTKKEFDLLMHFTTNPEQVFSRDELLYEVWGNQYSGFDHTVNSHINRLRQKIEPNPKNPHYIRTVWGVGYKFVFDQGNSAMQDHN